MPDGNAEEKETHANVTLAKEANARAAAMKKRLESARAALKGLDVADKTQTNVVVEAPGPKVEEPPNTNVEEPPNTNTVIQNVFTACRHDHVGIYFEKEMEFYNACLKRPAYMRRLLSAQNEDGIIEAKSIRVDLAQCTIKQFLTNTVLNKEEKGSNSILSQCDHIDIIETLFVQLETFFRERWNRYALDLIDVVVDSKYMATVFIVFAFHVVTTNNLFHV